MKKQSHYRVYLYPSHNGICMNLALTAIRSNGVDSGKLTLQDMESLFKNEALSSPYSLKNCKCTVEGHVLTIDEKKDDIYICLLAIEEIELVVLQPEQPPYLAENEAY